MYITPPLTTVKFPFYEQGKKAAELIIGTEELKNTEIYYETEIIERESVREIKGE